MWLSKFNEETPYPEITESVRVHGEKTGIAARSLFGNYVLVDDFSNEAKLNRTQIYFEEDQPIIAEASFNYNGLFCSVDILKKSESSYEIYEVKSATEIKETYISDAAFQYYVLTKLGYKISKVNLAYINNQYERQGDFDISQLFNIKNITKDVKGILEEIEKNVENIRLILSKDDETQVDIGIQCFKPDE